MLEKPKAPPLAVTALAAPASGHVSARGRERPARGQSGVGTAPPAGWPRLTCLEGNPEEVLRVF